MENKWYVYRHIKIGTNEVFYIGIGSSKKFKRAKTSYNRNKYWHNIVNKHGFETEILTHNISLEDAKELEKLLISYYKRIDCCGGILVNMTDGGEGSYGRIFSEDTKLKMSKAARGKILSQETKDKIGNFQRGIKRSEEFAKKISKIHKGKIISTEMKEQISKTKTGVSNPHKNIPIIQLDKEGNLLEEWNSITDACLYLELKASAISNNLKGLSNYCGGFKFKYKNKE